MDVSDLPERLRERVVVDGSCWRWTGALNGQGYATLGSDSSVHRTVYELACGPIPPRYQTDHSCRRHDCVNPAHMEAVTQRANILRGVGPTAVNARKTHCKRGHEFTPENTYRSTSGGRGCRICKRTAYGKERS